MTSPVIAVVGGGQLARMMTPAATALGYTLRVLVESPEASAALAAHETVVGMPGDADAIAALLAEPRPVVLTFEHEHIPPSVFAAAAAAGVPALPSEGALLYAQDKIQMRQRLSILGVPCPDWTRVASAKDVEEFLEGHDGIGVLKTARGGYDGKGVRVIRSVAEAEDWLASAAAAGPALLMEEYVSYTREIAVQVARSASGQVRVWPAVESRQRAGVCSEVIAPAPDLSPAAQREARRIAELIVTKLDVVGVLAVEMFEVNGRLLVNELAMRPHNSGHWSIDACVTDQFEQHLRAVAGLPLGDTAMTATWAVMANVFGGARENLATAHADITDPSAKVHLYGKEVRAGRKVGHVTVAGNDADDALARAVLAAAIVSNGGGK